jgi:hypothetical protein
MGLGMSPANHRESTPDLNDGEVIEWNRSAGLSIVIFVVQGCLPLILSIIVIAIIMEVGRTAGLTSLIIASIISPFVLLIVLVYILYMYIQVKRTEYYITNQRLLEVRGGTISKQILRANLEDLQPDQFLKQRLSHERRGGPTYLNLTITDPTSGIVIKMTAMPDDVVYIVSKISKKYRY